MFTADIDIDKTGAYGEVLVCRISLFPLSLSVFLSLSSDRVSPTGPSHVLNQQRVRPRRWNQRAQENLCH